MDAQVYADMNGWLVGFSPFEFQRMWPQHMKSAWRAYAMSDLGIPPAIEGEVWRLPTSRRMLWGFKTGPNNLFSAYRSYDEATSQAKSDLESKVDAKVVSQAIQSFGIDPEKPNPLAGEIIAEDFGWVIPVKSEPYSLHVACSSSETQNGWMVFAFAEGGLMSRLFGRDRSGAALESLYVSVRRCLEVESSVTGLREET